MPEIKIARETCLLIRVRPKNNLYLAPRTISFDGEVFYSVWQEMEPPQLVVGTLSSAPTGQNLLYELTY